MMAVARKACLHVMIKNSSADLRAALYTNHSQQSTLERQLLLTLHPNCDEDMKY